MSWDVISPPDRRLTLASMCTEGVTKSPWDWACSGRIYLAGLLFSFQVIQSHEAINISTHPRDLFQTCVYTMYSVFISCSASSTVTSTWIYPLVRPRVIRSSSMQLAISLLRTASTVSSLGANVRTMSPAIHFPRSPDI